MLFLYQNPFTTFRFIQPTRGEKERDRQTDGQTDPVTQRAQVTKGGITCAHASHRRSASAAV